MSFSLVISSETGVDVLVAKRTSRFEDADQLARLIPRPGPPEEEPQDREQRHAFQPGLAATYHIGKRALTHAPNLGVSRLMLNPLAERALALARAAGEAAEIPAFTQRAQAYREGKVWRQ